jgi:glycine cleavage system protein P-like pyridoxal-binding family
MAGMDIELVEVSDDGSIDMKDLKEKVNWHVLKCTRVRHTVVLKHYSTIILHCRLKNTVTNYPAL